MAAEVARAAGARPVWFFELQTDDPLLLWSGLGPRVWDSKTWQGSGALVEVGPVSEAASNKATGVRLTLNAGHPVLGETAFLGLVVAAPVTGRMVRVWRAFLDDDGQVIGDPSRPMIVGRADTLEIDDSGPQRKISLTVERLSRDQGRASKLTHSHVAQRAVAADDDFFVYAAGVENLTIVWPVFATK
jgi:hypothetical protein